MLPWCFPPSHALRYQARYIPPFPPAHGCVASAQHAMSFAALELSPFPAPNPALSTLHQRAVRHLMLVANKPVSHGTSETGRTRLTSATGAIQAHYSPERSTLFGRQNGDGARPVHGHAIGHTVVNHGGRHSCMAGVTQVRALANSKNERIRIHHLVDQSRAGS